MIFMHSLCSDRYTKIFLLTDNKFGDETALEKLQYYALLGV